MKAVDGEDVRVNLKTIEMRLADIWREEQEDEEHAVTRAALWNVVAHTRNSETHAHAAEVLSRASAAVPQRTIVIRADTQAPSEISSWISANCHVVGDGRQVCSEEVNIVAGGDRVEHVPPLVHALLLPDMPVAVWWIGDLPDRSHVYADELLGPADRLIVDSSHFDSVEDLELVCRIADQTVTAPADLAWARLEQWRVATAGVFDPPTMRGRLRDIAQVRVTCGRSGALGDRAEPLLFVSWLAAQTSLELPFELDDDGLGPGMRRVEIRFGDGFSAVIHCDPERGVVVARWDQQELALDSITRAQSLGVDGLIVRLLQRPETDRVYVKTLRAALTLAARLP
jgi:glucose-6-phosphate dehydrogenase assembly protein OpcA